MNDFLVIICKSEALFHVFARFLFSSINRLAAVSVGDFPLTAFPSLFQNILHTYGSSSVEEVLIVLSDRVPGPGPDPGLVWSSLAQICAVGRGQNVGGHRNRE